MIVELKKTITMERPTENINYFLIPSRKTNKRRQVRKHDYGTVQMHNAWKSQLLCAHFRPLISDTRL